MELQVENPNHLIAPQIRPRKLEIQIHERDRLARLYTMKSEDDVDTRTEVALRIDCGSVR